MRRILSLALASVLALTMLSGCNKTEGNGDNDDTSNPQPQLSVIGESVEEQSNEAFSYDFKIPYEALTQANVRGNILSMDNVKSVDVRMEYLNTLENANNITDTVTIRKNDDGEVQVYSLYEGMQSLVVSDEAAYMQSAFGCVMRQYLIGYSGLISEYMAASNFGASGFEYDISDKLDGDTYTITCKTKAYAFLTNPTGLWGIPDNNAVFQTFVFDAKTNLVKSVSTYIKDAKGTETELYRITYSVNQDTAFPKYYEEMTDPSRQANITYVYTDGTKVERQIAKGAYLDYVVDAVYAVYSDKACTKLFDRTAAPISGDLTLYIGAAPKAEAPEEAA